MLAVADDALHHKMQWGMTAVMNLTSFCVVCRTQLSTKKKPQQQQQHQSALCDSGLGLTHRHKKDITVTQLTHPCLLVAAFVFIFFLHCVCVCVFGQATSKARGKRGEREREKREEREERRGERIIYTTRGKAHSISASKGSTASLPAVSPD